MCCVPGSKNFAQTTIVQSKGSDENNECGLTAYGEHASGLPKMAARLITSMTVIHMDQTKLLQVRRYQLSEGNLILTYENVRLQNPPFLS
jgi:hypothetical protein